MSTRGQRSSVSSSKSSEKLQSERSSSMPENGGKSVGIEPPLTKKRVALTNLTNQRNGQNSVRNAVVLKTMVPCDARISKTKKGSSTISSASISQKSLPASLKVKSRVVVSSKDASLPRVDPPVVNVAAPPVISCMDISPSRSDRGSISLDETMSTCDSLKSPEYEYIDRNDALAVNSIERKTCNTLKLVDMEKVDKVVDIDDNITDPQLCASIACEMYNHLRASETKKRPSTDFIERIQKDVNASMRAILIDWLVEVAEEYRLVPETLFLTINYIDRYLSGNTVNRQRLQLLGVACMMIAAKYEEICAPQLEEFVYITDNTYLKEEVLQMESKVLNYLKFEMAAPTSRCFLKHFLRAAEGINEVSSMQLECLASYLIELSLLEYSMLCYSPSQVAASATFLARFMLIPSERPWTSTLGHYSLYKPSDLSDCVKALHCLCYNSHSSSLRAVREKYSQHKFKFVAKKTCPPSIQPEYFCDLISN